MGILRSCLVDYARTRFMSAVVSVYTAEIYCTFKIRVKMKCIGKKKGYANNFDIITNHVCAIIYIIYFPIRF